MQKNKENIQNINLDSLSMEELSDIQGGREMLYNSFLQYIYQLFKLTN